MRNCTKCKIDKFESDFYRDITKKSGFSSQCKKCQSEKRKGCPVLAEKRRIRLIKYGDTIRANKKKSYQKHKSNKMQYKKNRRANDHMYRFTENLRTRARTFLNNQMPYGKKSKTTELLGADYITVYDHIESLFTSGMSWWMIGKHIHIDHIIPLSSAKTEEEAIKLFHYTNLQPLWAEDNLKKGSKILKTS